MWPARLLPAILFLAALPAWGEGEAMFDPRFREGAPSDALVAGPPRLSRGHVNAFVDMLESAFDLAFTGPDEQALRDAVENEFDAAKPEQREAFLRLVEPIVLLREKARVEDTAAVREALRRFRAAVDARIRQHPDAAAHRLVTRTLERRHEVVGAGEPALKGVPVDAYVEMVEFVTSLARNERVALSPGRRSALRDYLARDFRTLSQAVREQLAGAHRLWLRAKARWDRGKEPRRFSMRWKAVQLGARLIPEPQPMKIEIGAELVDYAREASRVAAAMDPYDAATAFARNPQALIEALVQGLALEGDGPTFSFLYR